MMALSSVLSAMTDRGITFIVREGQLCVSAPRDSLTRELREALAAYRDELTGVLGIKSPPGANNQPPGHLGVVGNGVLDDALSGMSACPAELPVSKATTQHGSMSEQIGAHGRLGVGSDIAYRLVNGPEEFRVFLARLGRQNRVAFDLETTGLDPTRARIVGYAFCWQASEAWYLPVQAPEGNPHLDYESTLEQLRPVFEDPDIAKINQNIKYDMLVLRHHGVVVAGVGGDPMVADYLLRAGEREHGLDALALRYLDYQTVPITDLIGKRGRKKTQLSMADVPLEKITIYAAEDADVAFRLDGLMENRLRGQGLDRLYADLEIPLVQVLAELESNGIRLDVALLEEVSKELAQPLATLQKEVHDLAKHAFNLNSPKQIRQVLYEEMRLPVPKFTATGEASTDAEALDHLARQGYELPKKLQEQRTLAKLKSTYVDALPRLVSPATGRLHTSFNQAVTVTGRLSSSRPNLQNIPMRNEQGQKVRQAFVPAEGWVLLKADYSQIELRMLAHFSGDAELRRAYQENRDIHSLVAGQCFQVPEDKVSSDQRRFAKTINFGVIYGMSAHGLAKKLGISKEEAAKFIDAYFARYPSVARYQDELLNQCRLKGYVVTLLGRRRYIRGIRLSTNYRDRNQPEREAVNMQIQGSAADLLKLAMINVYRRLRRERLRARMLLTVHDELVLEVPPEELQAVADLVKEEMEGAIKLAVTIKVDLAAGPNWLHVEKLN